jgi:hypothetical protein
MKPSGTRLFRKRIGPPTFAQPACVLPGFPVVDLALRIDDDGWDASVAVK